MLDHQSFIQLRKEEIEQRAREAWKFERPVRNRRRFSLEFFRRPVKTKEKFPADCGCVCAPC